MKAGPLKVTPVNLYIEGPFDRQRWTRFSLTNEHGKCQAYKIKSTRPDLISVNPNIGFIHAFDHIEIVVTLTGNCFDPMMQHHEKFIIKSTFTDVPCTLWTETSPKPMLRNVANLAEVKLDLVLTPGEPCKKSSEERTKSSASSSLSIGSRKQQNTRRNKTKRDNDCDEYLIGYQQPDDFYLNDNDDKKEGDVVDASINDMINNTDSKQNKMTSSEKTQLQKTTLPKEINNTNQRNPIEVLKRVVSSDEIEEFKTEDDKKYDMNNNNTKQHVGNISSFQSQSKNAAQLCAFTVGAVALVLAFGLGRMTAIGNNPLQ